MYSASVLGVNKEGKSERTTLFRRAEIRDLAHSVLVDQDVVRLHVPMQDAEAVQVLESVQDLEREEANDVFLELEIEGVSFISPSHEQTNDRPCRVSG